MDTNSKQFQDAVYNLTSAYVQFLNTVSPVNISQELTIQYIAQSLQQLSSQFSSLSGETFPMHGVTNNVQPVAETTDDGVAIAKPVVTSSDVVGNPSLPKEPNLFRETASSDSSGHWFFERPRPQDGDSKLFKLYTNGDDGEFEMKSIEPGNWLIVYENRERVFPPAVVAIEGEMTPNAKSICIERGRLHREEIGGRSKWKITNPCRVQVTPC